MNRLSVRLSIVGAVMTLGASAVAFHLLSNPEPPAAESETAQTALVQASPDQPALPIRTDEMPEQPPVHRLVPPPASVFTRREPLQTVSHEDPTENSALPVPTADPIPTLGASDPQNSAYSTYEPASPLSVDSGNETAADDALYAQPAERNGSARPRANGALRAVPADDGAVAEPPPYGADAQPSDNATAAPRSVAAPANSSGSKLPPPPSSFPLAQPASPTVSPAAGATTGATTDATTDDVRARGSDRTLSPGPDMTKTGADDYPSTSEPFGGYGAASRAADSRRAATPLATPRAAPLAAPAPDAARRLESAPAADASAALPASVAENAAAAALSSNVPGDRALEGQQSPTIVLEKTAPDEIQVDKKATFQIRVRNVGNAAAHNVVVVDQVPRGTEFVDSVPECAHTPDGVLVWNLKSLEASEEVTLAINLMPKVAGEIGSVAQVTFQAQAAVRTICTKPALAVELTIPPAALIGGTANLEIVVTNTGSGAATNVVIEEDVPEGFTHAAGRQLEHEIGTLLPQESRRLSLVLDATKPGVYENRLTVRGDGNLYEEDVRKIEVSTPKLEITMQGPALRYLDRQATYLIRMANPGTFPACNVELVAYLPKGMKYVTSDNHGQYDSQAHAVYWSLEELPVDKQGDVHLTVLPIEPGNHKLKVDGHADLGLQHSCEHEVVVEGLAELSFSVADAADPIEVGSETTYEVRVHNRGSKADSEILVAAELPPGMTPVSGDGPVQATVQGQRVIFNPLARLAPDEEAVFKVHATGETTGDHVIRVQLQSAEVRVPVTKEESTRVYTDQ